MTKLKTMLSDLKSDKQDKIKKPISINAYRFLFIASGLVSEVVELEWLSEF